MAELTKDEADQLAALQAKAEAPDEPKADGPQRILNVSVDLGDPEQVKRAIGLGLLTEPEVEAAAEGEPEGELEEEPQRRGYFKDK